MTREEIRILADSIMERNGTELKLAMQTMMNDRLSRAEVMDNQTPEGMAQRTIENLSKGGILASRTVERIKEVADRAVGDVAVNRAFGRK